jgi:uncharacterized protein
MTILLDPVTLELDLGSLKTGSNLGEFEIDCAEVDWDIPEAVPASPKGLLRLDVNYREKSVVCRGSFTAGFRIPCARCLEPAAFSVSEDIFAAWTADADNADESVRPFPGGRHLGIFDAVREAIILSIPGKPLCREDCRGLCHVCGANLNRETCAHSGPAETGKAR